MIRIKIKGFNERCTHIRWSRVKLVYDPSGGGEIVHRYCHLAIDGIHSVMLRTRTVTLHDYFKLTTDRQLTSILSAEVGNEYASKRLSRYCYYQYINGVCFIMLDDAC